MVASFWYFFFSDISVCCCCLEIIVVDVGAGDTIVEIDHVVG